MSTRIRILITGASGFIGGKLAACLVERGYRLRCQYRRSELPPGLRDLESRGAQMVRMDLTPPKSTSTGSEIETYKAAMGELVDGVDGVFHVAALASDWGPDEVFERVNVEATRELLDAAVAAGVGEFVAVSSLAVHGFGAHRNSTEKGPYYPPVHAYQDTKLRAEKLVLSHAGGPMAVSVIRPGNVYGPDDTTMMFPILDAMEKGMMGTLAGGRALTSPVYIDDLLSAMVAAFERREANGEVFNITGGEWVTWKQFLNTAAAALGRRALRLNIPGFVALGAAHLMNGLWHVVNSKNAPPLTPYRVTQLLQDYHFDITKAQVLLGYVPTIRYEEGLKRTARSFLLLKADRQRKVSSQEKSHGNRS